MPMVMITGQKGILSRKQARFQVVDIVSTMTPLTKMAHQIVSPATIPSMVREAFRVAQQERPGPVHLELPEDIAHETGPDMSPVPSHPIDPPVAQRAALDRAAELILKAERPLVMLGAAASRPRLAEALSEFVRRVQIPFFNTQMGKGAVTGGSGLYMGTAALSERDYVHRAIDRADLIIAIGHDTVEKPPFFMGPDGPTVLHVGYLPATVEEVFFPHAELVGDVGPSLTLLADRLEGGLPRAGALLRLARGDPCAYRRPRGGKPLPADAAADRPRRAAGDAGRRHRLPRQRHVQDLVRAQLPHPCREHPAARQRARHHGRRPAVGDDGGHAQSGPPRACGLRRRRVHDELAGAGDGGAAEAQSRRAGARRTTLTE